MAAFGNEYTLKDVLHNIYTAYKACDFTADTVKTSIL